MKRSGILGKRPGIRLRPGGPAGFYEVEFSGTVYRRILEIKYKTTESTMLISTDVPSGK
jgi:hypothetical protein